MSLYRYSTSHVVTCVTRQKRQSELNAVSFVQSYPDKRLGKCVRNNGISLASIGVLLHKFHSNWGKGYSSFSGSGRFMGVCYIRVLPYS